MKTIEEKAIAYDEAIERAKKVFNREANDREPGTSICEYIFPELAAESDDEKIRKELIDFFQDWHKIKPSRLSVNVSDILAWLEKQGEEKKITHEEVSNANKDEVIRCLINGMKFYYEDNAEATWGTEKFSMKVKDILSWLEKQDTERKQLYVRFGDIPSNEKSKIYHGEEEIGDENGVSVYPAFELNGNIVLGLTLPITKTTLYTQQHLLEYDNRPCYLVSGDYVDKGTDGEPLIKNISVIKRLDNYRIKECEKKPAIEMITPEESLGIDSETYNDIVNTCIFGENKPKFKVGDWIVNRLGNIWHIDSFDANNYQVTTTKGEHNYFPINIQDRMHLWTIADAKDSDVLAIDSWSDYPSSFVVIYKKQNGEDFDSYCFVGFDGKFYKGENGHSTEEIHPATKEQCDLLFQKMKEEGYEWDAEKKELKKINEQHLISNYFNAEYERGKSDALKSVAWSEEDEKIIKRIDSLLYAINESDFEDIHAWLKSLKERCTWKPSNEQMHAFKQVYDWYNNDFAQSETLTSLYNDLMKLK